MPFQDDPFSPATSSLDASLQDAAGQHLGPVVARHLAAGANPRRASTTPCSYTTIGRTTGNTPLHLALRIEGSSERVVNGGCLDVVQRLIDAGADLNARNDQGYTPLQLGIQQRFVASVKGSQEQGAALIALVHAGADVNHVGPEGSPLVWALESNRHDALVRALRAAGATLGYAPGTGDPAVTVGPGSALLGALFNGTLAQVKVALDLGEDPGRAAVSLPNTSMYTGLAWPLIRATQRLRQPGPDDFDAVLELLVDAGLDLPQAVREPTWAAMVLAHAAQGTDHAAWARIGAVMRRAEAVELRRLGNGLTAPEHVRPRL